MTGLGGSQVSTAVVGRPAWKEITADATVRAWGRKERPQALAALAAPKPRAGQEGEGEEEVDEEVRQAREEARVLLLQTPRQAARQAFHRNRRLVSECEPSPGLGDGW